MDKPSPDLNAIKGRRPVLQNCSFAELEIDPEYQRSIDTSRSQRLIRSIARDWDWRLCQPLVVARRREGDEERYFVVVGQHRLAAARLRGDLYDLPCVVTEYADRADEAAAFVALNQQRRALSAIDLFKADVAAGDTESRAMMRAIDEAGLTLAPHLTSVAWKPGMVGNIGGIRKAWREHGAVVADRALKVLAAAFAGQVLRFGGRIFAGIVDSVANPPEGADDELLVMILSEDDQETWGAKIDACRLRLGCSAKRAAEIEISEAYGEAAAEMLEEAA